MVDRNVDGVFTRRMVEPLIIENTAIFRDMDTIIDDIVYNHVMGQPKQKSKEDDVGDAMARLEGYCV